MTANSPPDPAPRTTMRDVARASGVSPATVSFVLNGTIGQSISPATRERVERAARELGYVPHGIARALREGSSRTVLLNLDPEFGGGSLDGYIRGLGDELAVHGHVLLVRYGHAADSPLESVIEAVSPRAVIDLATLYRSGRPSVADGGWTDGLAAHTAVQIRYLVEAGHTRIAMALPAEGERDRIARIRLGLAGEAAAALGASKILPLAVPADRAGASAAIRRWCAAHPEVTAIAAFNDGIALRVLAGLRDAAIVVSRMSVIGFDDIELGAFAEPPLTTVRIESEVLGRRAALLALGQEPEPLVTPLARIVVRGSVSVPSSVSEPSGVAEPGGIAPG